MVDIGSKIKALRVEQKMTQSEFAARLGVAKSSISSYENGSRLPSYEILIKMARIFKVSTDTLLGQADEHNLTLNVSGLTKEQIAFLKASVEHYRMYNVLLNELPGEWKDKMREFVDTGKWEHKGETD